MMFELGLGTGHRAYGSQEVVSQVLVSASADLHPGLSLSFPSPGYHEPERTHSQIAYNSNCVKMALI